MEIEKRIALVTGGANGIGFAYATELLRNGAAHVAVLDLANSNGEEAVSKLNKEFGEGKAIFIICDVTKPQELEAGFAKTVEDFGGLDIVINNAGIMDDSRWELEININYTAVVRGTLLGLQYMSKEKGGKGGVIVNISSIVGVVPSEIFPIYAGTKFAVVGLSRSLGHPYHYEKSNVRILALCPNVTDTQLIVKSVGRSLDIVDAEKINDTWKRLSWLTMDDVSRGMMHIIRVAESGTVWVMDAGTPVYQFDAPNYPLMEVPADGKN